MPPASPRKFRTFSRTCCASWSARPSPDYIAVVFDPRGPTFRDKLFTEYKAQRPPMPEDLSIQLPFVRRLCEAMRLPTIEVDGYEADDVIGALARQAASASSRRLHRHQRQGHDAARRRPRPRPAPRPAAQTNAISSWTPQR